MIRTYLDWLIELPWQALPEEPIDIAEARRILDEDHYGLRQDQAAHPRVSRGAQARRPRARRRSSASSGRPASARPRSASRSRAPWAASSCALSLGGVHDEAEIRGHRRTYIGALPGNIIQAIRKAGARNAVMMLDEIDKLGRGIHGDPSAALLEVLDPEQNATFRDNYLAVPFDLSRVVFIATANVLDTIPGPLRDRMEIIELSGYTEDEKLEIAKRYLVQRQLEANGLKPEQAEITDDALRAIIDDYTREAGVRNLEREIGRALRNAAVEIAEGKAESRADRRRRISRRSSARRRFENEVAMRTSVPGVATGLAWTPVGGDILFVEATRMPGNGPADPHRPARRRDEGERAGGAEPGQGAASTRSASIPALFEKSDIHVHVPAGAIPKDGPSAGVAMFIASSRCSPDRTVRSDTAMTGEISAARAGAADRRHQGEERRGGRAPG